jgi:hypothetical protein
VKIDEVPQDHSSTYGGHRKLVYAVNQLGHYQPAQSDGWEAESYATQTALAELEALEQAAFKAWQAGQASPLECLMHRYRMDLPALAQVTGLWQWRIRRHFRLPVYRRLRPSVLQRYADAFGLPLAELIRYQEQA